MSSRRQYARTRLNLETMEQRDVPATLSTFLTDSHTDLTLGYTGGTNGTWSLSPTVDGTPSGTFNDSLLYVPEISEQARPTGSQYDFLGVAAGQPVYILPQSQDPNMLFMGIAGYNVDPNTFDSYNVATESKGRAGGNARWMKMTLQSVTGPGVVSAWQNDAFGTPVVFMSTFNDNVANPDGNGLDATDGISADDAFWIPEGSHTHTNFGFSATGRYEVKVRLSGYLENGNSGTLGTPVSSQDITLYFSVGNVGQLEFDQSSYTVNEGAGTASINVRRVGGSDGRLTVNYATSNGTATAGSDYTARSGTLTFNDLETSKTITIPITNDASIEANETINLTLSNAGPANIEQYIREKESSNLLGTNTTATLQINDNDNPANNTAPSISGITNLSIDEDTATSDIAFTVNDSESPATSLVVTATSSNTSLVPAGGITISGTNGNRTIKLTPLANQHGTTDITVTVTDPNGLTATSTFTLTVDPVNDQPIADSKSATTSQNRDVSITLSGSDIDNDTLSYIVNNPTNGTLSGIAPNIIYTPNLDYVGPDSFTYKVNDGTVDSTLKTVTLTVTQARNPVAGNDAYVVGAGMTVSGNVLFNDSDADNDPISVTIDTLPSHGSVTLNSDGTFTYTPDNTFTATDSFTYTLTDDTARTATGTVTFTKAVAQPALTTIIASGDADVGINYEAGAWDLHVHSETTGLEAEPGQAMYYIAPEALTPRGSNSNLDFIGVNAGENFYLLPQLPNPNLLYLGFGTEELATGIFTNDQVKLSLMSVNGPGEFSVWQSDLTGPNVFMASSDGITADDSMTFAAGAHSHFNLGFTARGRYEITFRGSGFLVGNPNEVFSDPVTYYFTVDGRGQVDFTPKTALVTEGQSTTLTVTRTDGTDGPLTVTYAAVGGKGVGIAGTADFRRTTGTLTFADGETTKTFNFQTIADRAKEVAEVATINLLAPVDQPNILGPDKTANVTIEDNAALRVLSTSINDGDVQRSNVVTVSIRFSRDTNIQQLITAGTINNAVKLFMGTTEISLANSRFFYFPLTNTLTIGLTTTGFNLNEKTILANGRYEVRLDTTLIKSGLGGISLQDTDRQTRIADGIHKVLFHRLEGDFNGDRKVTSRDVSALNARLNSFSWQRKYLYAFDLTGALSNPDGAIDITDLNYLKTKLNQIV